MTPNYDERVKNIYVMTRTERPNEGQVSFHIGSLVELARTLKARDGKNIYCDGGAEVIHELLENDLI